MRTPAGTECRHYYEDFHRGRETQECRLVLANRHSLPWREDLCARCRVPAVLRANGSPDLRLSLTVVKRFGFLTRLRIDAYCLKHACAIDDPFRGCAACAPDVDTGVAG